MAQMLSACKCQAKKCVYILLRKSCEKCVYYSPFLFLNSCSKYFHTPSFIFIFIFLTWKIFYHTNKLLQSKNWLFKRTQPAMLQNKLLDN